MNEYQQYAGQPQLTPQGFLGGLIGSPLGGVIGRGIGGIFGNPNLGSRIGEVAGGLGGGLLPFGADPVSAAYAAQLQQQQAQQGQLAPQGFVGNLFSQFGRPAGGLLTNLTGNPTLGNVAGSVLSGLGGLLPFGADPTSAYAAQLQQQQAQQGQLAPQGWLGNMIKNVAQPVGGFIGNQFGNQGLGNTIGGIAGQLGGMLPFTADPVSAAYAAQVQQQQAQQGQLAPQGWIGNMIKQVAQPVGGFIGSQFGNQGLGNTIGGIAGQIGGLLPFGADPVSAAYATQLQQQQAQQAQLAPQGFVGNLFSQFGRPAGSVLGNLTGNSTVGNIAGSVLSGLGGLLPFGADAQGSAAPQQQVQQHPLVQQLQQLQAQQQQVQQYLQQIQQQQAILQQKLAADQQGGQMAPQGWLGNMIKNVAQPVGGFIGGQFGNQALGNTIGGIAGQLGGMLPFSADPFTAYAQQQQYAGQQTLH